MKIVMPLVVGGSLLASVPAANAAGVCSASTPQYCPAPVVTTTAPTRVTASSAFLHGTVNPNGATTTCTFIYAVGSATANSTATQTIAAGSGAVPVTAQIARLPAKTKVKYALDCTNGGGTAVGNTVTFTTLARASRIGLVGKNGFVNKHRILTERLKCVGTLTCTGKVTVSSKGKTIASKTFRIKGNKRATVSLKLSKKLFRAIKRHPRKAKVTAKETRGNSASATVRLH